MNKGQPTAEETLFAYTHPENTPARQMLTAFFASLTVSASVAVALHALK